MELSSSSLLLLITYFRFFFVLMLITHMDIHLLCNKCQCKRKKGQIHLKNLDALWNNCKLKHSQFSSSYSNINTAININTVNILSPLVISNTWAAAMFLTSTCMQRDSSPSVSIIPTIALTLSGHSGWLEGQQQGWRISSRTNSESDSSKKLNKYN